MSQNKYDVVVVGGGSAGLLLGHELKKRGVSFVLLEKKPDIGQGATRKTKGLVSLFAMDNPARLEKDLGKGKASDLLSFFNRNNAQMRSALNEFSVACKNGIWYGAGFDIEHEELTDSAHLLQNDAEWRTSSPVLDAEGILYVKTAFSFDALTLIPSLKKSLSGFIVCDENVVMIEKKSLSGDATTVITTKSSYDAEVVVLCANAYLPQIFQGWSKFLYPVRAQSIIAKQKVFDEPVIVNAGHEIYVPDENGTWMGGINPNATFDDLTYDETPTDIFQGYMEMFFESRWGEKPEVVSRGAGTICMTQTGFPVIGPVPGRVDLIVMSGCGGRGWDYWAEGANAVTKLILDGKNTLPSLFHPSNVFV